MHYDYSIYRINEDTGQVSNLADSNTEAEALELFAAAVTNERTKRNHPSYTSSVTVIIFNPTHGRVIRKETISAATRLPARYSIYRIYDDTGASEDIAETVTLGAAHNEFATAVKRERVKSSEPGFTDDIGIYLHDTETGDVLAEETILATRPGL